jgi:hypothetical protein
MAAKTDLSDEIEFWGLIQDTDLNKTVITPTDNGIIPCKAGVV